MLKGKMKIKKIKIIIKKNKNQLVIINKLDEILNEILKNIEQRQKQILKLFIILNIFIIY